MSPAVQNILLKARDEGVGTALTTLLCVAEPQVKELLRIPDGVAPAAMLTLGYPVRPFPKRLRRHPLDQRVFAEEFGRPLPRPYPARPARAWLALAVVSTIPVTGSLFGRTGSAASTAEAAARMVSGMLPRRDYAPTPRPGRPAPTTRTEGKRR